jgi:hypothetical protein
MNKTNLSRKGQERRDQMLTKLQMEVTFVARRRSWQRRAVATAPVVLLAFGLWWFIGNDAANQPVEVAREIVEPGKTELIDPFSVEQAVVSNRSGVVQRYVVNTNDVVNSNVQRVSDGELLDLLALAGKPSVLGRIDGQLTVIPITQTHVPSTH